MTLHNAGSFAGFNKALKREGIKREKEVITTQGICIWSPIQVLTPQNRAKLYSADETLYCPCGTQ